MRNFQLKILLFILLKLELKELQVPTFLQGLDLIILGIKLQIIIVGYLYFIYI